jgi:alpha/beta superfamily hydrolase
MPVNKVLESEILLKTPTGTLSGTLLIPGEISKYPVALIIAGSGPTDRDGNNTSMKNNSLKLLATSLAEHQIASLRYDKRGIGASREAAISEADLRFEDFIEDARDWIGLLIKDKRFSEVIVIGHSEGSLIGMVSRLPSGEEHAPRAASVHARGVQTDRCVARSARSARPSASARRASGT